MKKPLICLSISLMLAAGCTPPNIETPPSAEPTPNVTPSPVVTPTPAPVFQGSTTIVGTLDLDVQQATIEINTLSGKFRQSTALASDKTFRFSGVPVGEQVRIQVQYRNNPRVVLSARLDIGPEQNEKETLVTVSKQSTVTDLIYERAIASGKTTIAQTSVKNFENHQGLTTYRNAVLSVLDTIMAVPVDAIQVTIPTAPNLVARIDEVLPSIEAILANQPLPTPTAPPSTPPTTSPSSTPSSPGVFTPVRLLVKPGNKISIAQDTSLKLWVVGVDVNNQQQLVSPTWTPGQNSSNATLDSAGVFTPNDSGTFTYTVNLGALSETVTIEVTDGDLESLELEPDTNFSLDTGRVFEMRAKGKDENGLDVTVTPSWELSNTFVGEINSDGVFTAKQPGRVDVTARARGFVATLTITVESTSTFVIEVEPNRPVVLKGKSQVFRANALDVSGVNTSFSINFTTQDGKIGEFLEKDVSITGPSPAGTFRALANGTTDIFIRDVVTNRTISMPVTVAENVPYISSVSPNTTVLPGQTVTLNGENFSANASENQVFFNNIQGTVVSATPTALNVTVPVGAFSGFVSITSAGKKGNAVPFVVSPVLNNIIPLEAEEGDLVTLTGSHFATDNPAHNVVFFGNTQASVPINVTGSSLQVLVPSFISSEVDVSIRVKGQLTNFQEFNVAGANLPTWTERANAPSSRSGAHARFIDGNLYVLGSSQSSTADRLEVYDVTNDEWDTLSDLPDDNTDFAVAVDNDFLYVFGGSGSSDSVYRYDPDDDEWTQVEDMPTGRSGAVAETVGGKIYVIGGEDSDGRVVEEYDPDNDEWETMRLSPSRRVHAASAVYNSRIYVIGGGETAEDRVTAYDPDDDEWITGFAPLPKPVTKARAVVINSKIYVIGGEDQNGNEVDSVYEYDPARDSWRTIKRLPSARSAPAVTAISSRIYVVGGENSTGGTTNTLFRGTL